MLCIGYVTLTVHTHTLSVDIQTRAADFND